MAKAIQLKDSSGTKCYPYPYFPIGYIYMSTSSTNPGTLFGGTWTRIKDTFLLACGDTYAAASTGGEAEHRLDVTEIPEHTHQQRWVGEDGNVNPLVRNTGSAESAGVYRKSQTSYYNSSNKKQAVRTMSTGGSMAHNNMPPYIAVYVWERTA